MSGKGVKSKTAKIWKKFKEEIMKDMESNISDYAIAKKYGVSSPTVKDWRVNPIDNPERLKAINDVKNSMALVTQTERSLKPKAKTVESFKEKGTDFLNDAMDRLLVLLPTEKSMLNIAKVMDVILPYLASKLDTGGESGDSFESRRSAFIQNVQNNYNIKMNRNETDKEIINYRHSEEPATGVE